MTAPNKCKVWYVFHNHVVLETEDGTKFSVPKSVIQESSAGFQLSPMHIIHPDDIHPPLEPTRYVRVGQVTLDEIAEISDSKAMARARDPLVSVVPERT